MRRFCAALLAFLLCTPVAALGDTTAATVDGIAVTWEDVQRRMAGTNAINAQAGDGLTDEEKAAREAALRRATLDALIEEAALLAEADRRGLYASDLREDIEARYGRMLAAAKDYVLAAYPGLSEAELLSQVDALFKGMGSSLEYAYETARRSALLAALDRALASQIAAPAADALYAAYDALWREQKALFDADENALEAALLRGDTVLCRPRTLKLIQKAEFLFDPGALALINQTKETSEAAAREMLADQQARARTRAEAALAALDSGEMSFAQLLEALEPGSGGRVNYFHATSTRFSEDYAARARAFATPGEHSDLYELPNGYALLYYKGDLPALERVPFEDAAGALARDWAEENLSEALRMARAEIVARATVERFGGEAP